MNGIESIDTVSGTMTVWAGTPLQIVQEAARDATQEVFRKALGSPDKLADPDVALPFIYRIATNHCLNERRNSGRRGETELADLDVASDHPDFPTRRLVQRVLSRFDAKTQSIAVGVLVDGMEHEEVADVEPVVSRGL